MKGCIGDLLQVAAVPLYGKMAGAVGNYNAHMSAYPNVDWQQVAQSFVCDRMGVQWNPYVTQVSQWSSSWCACCFQEGDLDCLKLNCIHIEGIIPVAGFCSLSYMCTQALLHHSVALNDMGHIQR